MGYGECLTKMLNQNDQYEIAEWYYHDIAIVGPAKVFQPIDTQRVKEWDKITNLTKTGKLTPESPVGQGEAPYKVMWCGEKGTKVTGPSRYVIMVSAWHNADSIGYNPKATGRPIGSWGELLNKEWNGKVGLLNVPSIGTMDCAMAVEALGLKKFGDKGNMTKPEIDFLIDYIIPLKKGGHFRAFWENFGQSVNLMVNGEVALESMWSPAVAAIQAEGVPCVYAFPKEGMRGWHGGLSISVKVQGKQQDQAYSTSIGGLPVGRPRLSHVRVTITRYPTTRRSTSNPWNGIIGIWANPRQRTYPIRSVPSLSRRATFGPAAPIGTASRSPYGTP
jgi:putative spermidine/putrescine transport system substrate-binding protein